jgi:microcystin-dependent protein
MKKKIIITLALFALFCAPLSAQSIVIGKDEANSAALLDINSTAKGILIPRLTSVQRIYIAIDSLAAGVLVYQTDGENGFYLYNGTAWVRLITDVDAANISSGETTLPTLAAVATSGKYDDVQNKPEIPVRLEDMEQDEKYFTTVTKEERTLWNNIARRYDFSGSYKDLTDKPYIPTKLSELEQDNDYYTLVTTDEKALWNNKLEKQDIPTQIQAYGQDTTHLLVTAQERNKWNTAAERGTFSGRYEDLTNLPILATVATTGSYKDLLDVPKIDDNIFSVDDTTPIKLARVAYTGDYKDIIGKPILTDEDGHEITLARVAVTGDFKDLTDKPYIPTRLSELEPDEDYYTVVTQVEKDFWNSKVDGDKVPVRIEDYLQDTGHTSITKAEWERWEEAAANTFSGKWFDLRNIPEFAGVATSGSYYDLGNLPLAADILRSLYLHRVATTGEYDHLENKPLVPTKLSELTQDDNHSLVTDYDIMRWSAFVSEYNEHKEHTVFSGDYMALNNKPQLAAVATTGRYIDLSDRPTAEELKRSLQLHNAATTGKYDDLIEPDRNVLDNELHLSEFALNSGGKYYKTFFPESYPPVVIPYLINAPVPTFMDPQPISLIPDYYTVGTSNEFARADHTHPFINSFSDIAIMQELGTTKTTKYMDSNAVINLKYINDWFGGSNNSIGWCSDLSSSIPNSRRINMVAEGNYSVGSKSRSGAYGFDICDRSQTSRYFYLTNPRLSAIHPDASVGNSGFVTTYKLRTYINDAVISSDNDNSVINTLNNKFANTSGGMLQRSSYLAALPLNSVIMYTGTVSSLPPCWQLFTAMEGRMPVGVGTADKPAEGDNNPAYQPGNTGGTSTVKLTEEHIPPHFHRKYYTYNNSLTDGNRSDAEYMKINKSDQPYNDYNRYYNLDNSGGGVNSYDATSTNVGTITTSQGSNDNRNFHNNMPPYRGIFFIKKTSNECK